MSAEYLYQPDKIATLTLDELEDELEHLDETLALIESNRNSEGFYDSEGLVAASERFFSGRREQVQKLLGSRAVSSI